jgi:hypothetical protein
LDLLGLWLFVFFGARRVQEQQVFLSKKGVAPLNGAGYLQVFCAIGTWLFASKLGSRSVDRS